ncbi:MULTISPECIES: hypothetical protein [unclassified Ruegeria]|uniref:hypothetical protein n=1 Tax=unclassified Ruegeria TaxID=2625375 RepID=UPI001AEB02D8|nr:MULTISPECIES: hypothetical protein [unclassified Ruegeria]
MPIKTLIGRLTNTRKTKRAADVLQSEYARNEDRRSKTSQSEIALLFQKELRGTAPNAPIPKRATQPAEMSSKRLR